MCVIFSSLVFTQRFFMIGRHLKPLLFSWLLDTICLCFHVKVCGTKTKATKTLFEGAFLFALFIFRIIDFTSRTRSKVRKYQNRIMAILLEAKNLQASILDEYMHITYYYKAKQILCLKHNFLLLLCSDGSQ